MTIRRLTRPARHGLAAVALRLLFGLLRLLPVTTARRLGAALGRGIGLVARRERRAMADRLGQALGSHAPPVGACWASLGRRAVEFALADRMLDRVTLAPEAVATFAAARAEGRGVLLATAHLGNWELMAAALAARGFAVHAVAAAPRSGPLHRWLAAHRARLGVSVIAPGGGARTLVERLRAGQAAALFVDQATGRRCRDLPVFGRPAPTPTTFPRLLALTGARPLFIHAERRGTGYQVVLEPVVGADPLAAVTARIEAAVRRDPAEWVWLHDRWRDTLRR